MTLQMAADNPDYGASLAARLAQAGTSDSSDAAMIREFLHAATEDLERDLATKPGVRALASEYARAWAGPDLAAQLRGEALPSGRRPRG
jgi:hypothetical protein